MAPLLARVKTVLSGDTVVLEPAKTATFPPPERILTLSNVRGESIGAKLFLRDLLIGKEVKFAVEYTHPSTGKQFGDLKTPTLASVTEYLVENGTVKVKEGDSDAIDELKVLEEKAQAEQLGIWGQFPTIDVVDLDEKLISRSVKHPVVTIVERVINGDRVMARIIAGKNQHVVTPLLLAGIKCPRSDDAAQDKLQLSAAQHAKRFVEEKLMTTSAEIKVSVIGESQTGVPIAVFVHPSGNNIHEKLLEHGWGEVVDWQSTLVGSTTMALFRKAEQTAKALGKGMYATKTSGTTSSSSVGHASKGTSAKNLKPGSTVENVTVARVIGADTLTVRLPSNEEITVQLASLRAPRPNYSLVTSNSQQQQALVNTAREFVRQNAAGKTGTMYIDGYRPENKELGFDARFVVSLRFGSIDLSELIVTSGWATVIRHNKQTADERSLNWDRLVELEEEQKNSGKKGIFFKGDINKVLTVGTRIVDISENATKARSFLNGFKQKGRISGGYHVEFVNSVNRVRLFNPREGTRLTLILGGLANSKNEMSEEGLKYMNTKVLQKHVEFEIYDMDKLGGFIGNLYPNANSLKPIQISLLEQGFVKLHDIAVNSNAFEGDMVKAEDAAKAAKKGIWASYSEADTIVQPTKALSIETKPEFFDVEVSYVDSDGIVYFQKQDAATKNQFQTFKRDFDTFHQQNASASVDSVDLPFNLNKPPKKGELVSVKLDDNGKYYRGKVLSFDKVSNRFEVKHLDYGNTDNVQLRSLRSLPKKFSLTSIPAFAHSAQLQGLRLPPSEPVDYLTDALDLLDELTFEKKLVVSAVSSANPNVEYDVVLYDSQASLKDPSFTINKKLVEEGCAFVDETTAKTDYVSQLQKVQNEAIQNHKGCWKYGKVSFEPETL